MKLVAELLIKLFSKKVGHDQYGNEYYISKNVNFFGKKKRYVIYKNKDLDSSTVGGLWHAWLHYIIDDLNSIDNVTDYYWQQPHHPNLTGTKFARHCKIKTAMNNYSKWKPGKNK